MQEHEQLLRERQLTKDGGSKMHLIGAQPPYQLWYGMLSETSPLPNTPIWRDCLQMHSQLRARARVWFSSELNRSKEDIEAGARKAAQRAALLPKRPSPLKPRPAAEVRLQGRR